MLSFLSMCIWNSKYSEMSKCNRSGDNVYDFLRKKNGLYEGVKKRKI